MLRAVVGGHDDLLAANDVAVKAKDPGRILELRVKLGADLIAEFPADGVVVATATGSTAYNLSAGGPVLMPGVPAMVLTPICPHTLATRPLVLRPDTALTITLGEVKPGREAFVAVDGRRHFGCPLHQELLPGGRVRPRRPDHAPGRRARAADRAGRPCRHLSPFPRQLFRRLTDAPVPLPNRLQADHKYLSEDDGPVRSWLSSAACCSIGKQERQGGRQ